MGFCRNLAALNPNVRLTLFLSAVGGLADSLWSGTVLAAYLYEIDGDRNARVGYVEAASGLATLVTALPVGWAADKLGRGFVAACGGALSFAAVGLTAGAVLAPQSERAAFWWLLSAMALQLARGERRRLLVLRRLDKLAPLLGGPSLCPLEGPPRLAELLLHLSQRGREHLLLVLELLLQSRGWGLSETLRCTSERLRCALLLAAQLGELGAHGLSPLSRVGRRLSNGVKLSATRVDRGDRRSASR